MNVTRRSFIGGAAAFGAAGCARLVPVFGGFRREREPNLTLGVLSDVHVTFVGGEDDFRTGWGNEDALRHALEWYRGQGVDAVVIAGDLAEFGLVEQIKAVADVWEEVFPGDRAPDGRHVEKVFVTGNHDFEGSFYEYAAGFIRERYAGAKEDFPAWCRANALRADIPGLWKRHFHEDYARFFRKDVKGYAFLCQNWDDGSGVEAGLRKCEFGPLLKEYLDAHGGELDPARPFFYVQHPHPKGTCYSETPEYGGDDLVTATLSRRPNAIAISGHSHFTLTDERSVWQGAFTSVGASSLRYTGLPSGYVATGTSRWTRQGMLWKVYDDCIVMKRREFLLDRELGPDWVMPLPMAAPAPFEFAARRKKARPPRFAAGARLALRPAKDGCELLVPAPEDEPRCFEYEVVVEGRDGKSETLRVLAEGFNLPKGKETRVVLPAKDVAKVVVTPLDCWRNRGSPLVARR